MSFDSIAVTLAILGITLTAGLVRGYSGFGAGLIMTPCLSVLLGPQRAVPVVLCVGLAGTAYLVPQAIRHSQPAFVVPMALGACLFIPVGVYLLTALDGAVVQRIVSVCVLLFAALLGRGWTYRGRMTCRVIAAVGGISGLLTGIGAIGGPPVILFLLGSSRKPDQIRADLIIFFALTQVLAILTYFARGSLASWVAVQGVLLAPLFLLASYLGARLFNGRGKRHYHRFALSIITLAGLAGLFAFA